MQRTILYLCRCKLLIALLHCLGINTTACIVWVLTVDCLLMLRAKHTIELVSYKYLITWHCIALHKIKSNYIVEAKCCIALHCWGVALIYIALARWNAGLSFIVALHCIVEVSSRQQALICIAKHRWNVEFHCCIALHWTALNWIALNSIALHCWGVKQGAGISQLTATGNRSETCDLRPYWIRAQSKILFKFIFIREPIWYLTKSS